jgi:hypothetical protein
MTLVEEININRSAYYATEGPVMSNCVIGRAAADTDG